MQAILLYSSRTKFCPSLTRRLLRRPTTSQDFRRARTLCTGETPRPNFSKPLIVTSDYAVYSSWDPMLGAPSGAEHITPASRQPNPVHPADNNNPCKREQKPCLQHAQVDESPTSASLPNPWLGLPGGAIVCRKAHRSCHSIMIGGQLCNYARQQQHHQKPVLAANYKFGLLLEAGAHDQQPLHPPRAAR